MNLDVEFYNFVKLTFFAWFMLSLPLLFSLRRGWRAPHTRRFASFWVIFLVASGGLTAYRAISYEITGKAIYSTSRFSHEEVTRQSSPTNFRRATNMAWGWTGFCFLSAVIYMRKGSGGAHKNVVKVASEYSEEELARFREVFAPQATRYRRYARRSHVLFAIFGAIALIVAYLAATHFPNALVDWVCGLLVLGYLAMIGYSWRSQPLLECPGCQNRLDSGAFGRHCPQCGSPQFVPGGWLGSPKCTVCSETMHRGYKIRACTHCGVMLHERGIWSSSSF